MGRGRREGLCWEEEGVGEEEQKRRLVARGREREGRNGSGEKGGLGEREEVLGRLQLWKVWSLEDLVNAASWPWWVGVSTEQKGGL